TSSNALGSVGSDLQVVHVGDFSGRANESDLLMRSDETGAFELYDIRNNAVVSTTSLGVAGLNWQAAGFGDFSGVATETDMLLRDTDVGSSTAGDFMICDIRRGRAVGTADLGRPVWTGKSSASATSAAGP